MPSASACCSISTASPSKTIATMMFTLATLMVSRAEANVSGWPTSKDAATATVVFVDWRNPSA
eukprot:2562569-Prymnesium_polylepis.1